MPEPAPAQSAAAVKDLPVQPLKLSNSSAGAGRRSLRHIALEYKPLECVSSAGAGRRSSRPWLLAILKAKQGFIRWRGTQVFEAHAKLIANDLRVSSAGAGRRSSRQEWS